MPKKNKGTLSMFQTDKSKEKEGIELDFLNGLVVTVRRAGGSNQKFHNVTRREMKKYQHAINAGTLSTEQDRAIMVVVYVDSVIIGWEGLTDDDGKEIPFERNQAIEVLTENPDFFDAIKDQCEDMENFKSAELKEAAKN